MVFVLRFARWQRAASNPTAAGLGNKICSAAAPSWNLYFTNAASWAKDCRRMRCGSGFDPGGNFDERQQQQLGEEPSCEPSEGRERNLDRRSTVQPGLVRKLSRECFWVNNRHKPSWVDSGSTTLDVQLQIGLRRLQGSAYVKSSSPAADELQRLCEKGQLDKALDILDQEGIASSLQMYKILLKACTKKRALVQAKRVLSYLARHGQEYASFLGDSVISTLVRCGGLEDALQVFSGLQTRSVFCWTAVISGYTMSGQGRKALRLYQWMQGEGVQPNSYTIVSLLKACGSIPDLEQGKGIHREALKYGYETDLLVGTCLVDMYAKCGSLTDAQNVFGFLSHRDVVSWNVMLAAYSKQGQAEKALEMYEQMKNEGVSPNDRSFVSALQACGTLAEKEAHVLGDGRCRKDNALRKGIDLHADARTKGYHSDVFVGSSLVSMYGKFGSIVDAQSVFDGVQQRNVVLWNALLAAYAQQGQAEKVLQLYEQMCKDGISPDGRSFVCGLQACGMLAEKETCAVADERSIKAKSLEKGIKIHADAQKRGYKEDVFVSSTLISMYGRCRSITDAEKVFHELSQRNVVSWTAMLAAYVEQGEVYAQKAWQLYEHMQEAGVNATNWTLVSTLQACGMLAESEVGVDLCGQAIKSQTLEKVKAIHVEARNMGHHKDAIVGGFLVCTYDKCGSILDAQSVFDELHQRNAMSWTTVIAAYVERGQEDRALRMYEQMWEEGAHPYIQTFVVVLRACGMLAENEDLVHGLSIKVKSLELGKAVHAITQRQGCHLDVFIGTTLVSMYGKCGSSLDAQNVFDELHERDVVAWTAMLVSYVQQGQGEAALGLYEQMQEEGVSPDFWTLVSALQACGTVAKNQANSVSRQNINLKSLQIGKAMHAVACRKGFHSNDFIGSALINVYGKCGSAQDAANVFNGLPHRNVVAWTVMLSVYLEQGQGEKALQMYRQMVEECLNLDEVAIVSILQACSSTCSLDLCRQIHQTIVSTATNLSTALANTLVHAYGRCASMGDAQEVFDMLPQPDVISWNALIAGYGRQGNCAASMQCYKEMGLVGTKPDAATFLALLSACSHSGELDTGVEYFEIMTRDHGIIPEIEHYVSMVDLLGRAGKLSEVEDLVSTMPMQPNLAMWLCLLSACRQHGKVTLGKLAFDSAVRLQPDHTAAYFLMSSMYAEAGLQTSAEEVMDLSRKAGTRKKPGQSWTEHEHVAPKFLVGNRNSYAQQEPLFDLLRKVSSDLKVPGPPGPIHQRMFTRSITLKDIPSLSFLKK